MFNLNIFFYYISYMNIGSDGEPDYDDEGGMTFGQEDEIKDIENELLKKAKRAAYAKEWRIKNKEKHKQYIKNYRDNNREKVLKYMRDYTKRPEIREKRKQYIKQNKDKHNERCRNYYAKNRTRYKKYRKAYYEKNGDRLRAQQNYKNNKAKYKKTKDIIKELQKPNEIKITFD